jgi:hypothetical protein
LDIPILVFGFGLIVLAPHRVSGVKRDLKTLPGERWRGVIFNGYKQALIDLPYFLMLIVLIIFYPMTIKLRRQIEKRYGF